MLIHLSNIFSSDVTLKKIVKVRKILPHGNTTRDTALHRGALTGLTRCEVKRSAVLGRAYTTATYSILKPSAGSPGLSRERGKVCTRLRM